jgi:hypothetical protein
MCSCYPPNSCPLMSDELVTHSSAFSHRIFSHPRALLRALSSRFLPSYYRIGQPGKIREGKTPGLNSRSVVSESPGLHAKGVNLAEYSAHLSRFGRADERTRSAYPCSLRVIIQVLQGVARTCKFRICRRFSLLRLALHCTVLRSRWCQSGVRGPAITSPQCTLARS